MKPRTALAMGTCATLGLILSASVFATPMNDTAKAIALGHGMGNTSERSERVSKRDHWRSDRGIVSSQFVSALETSTVSEVPEPNSLALMAVGLLGAFILLRRKSV